MVLELEAPLAVGGLPFELRALARDALAVSLPVVRERRTTRARRSRAWRSVLDETVWVPQLGVAPPRKVGQRAAADDAWR